MKEIKFRAWHPSGGWEDERSGCTMTYWGLGSGLDNSVFFKCAKAIMQFTGLKDKNGKEIYEGDILCWPQYEGRKNQTRWCVEWNSERAAWPDWSPRKEAEIIGNIYETPELINQ